MYIIISSLLFHCRHECGRPHRRPNLNDSITSAADFSSPLPREGCQAESMYPFIDNHRYVRISIGQSSIIKAWWAIRRIQEGHSFWSSFVAVRSEESSAPISTYSSGKADNRILVMPKKLAANAMLLYFDSGCLEMRGTARKFGRPLT